MSEDRDASHLDEKLLAVVALLQHAEVPFAAGGAIALWFWSEPRGTRDIDINVFLPPAEAGHIADLLECAGILDDRPRFVRQVIDTGQVRVDYEGSPLDLFFMNLPFLEKAAERAVRVPFRQTFMHVLSAEDLVVCKAMFNRPKDWLDITQVVYTQGPRFDAAYARGWLEEMLGAGSEQARRLDEIVAEAETLEHEEQARDA